jgi:hypothetical protein
MRARGSDEARVPGVNLAADWVDDESMIALQDTALRRF